jgi:hypothetical protein
MEGTVTQDYEGTRTLLFSWSCTSVTFGLLVSLGVTLKESWLVFGVTLKRPNRGIRNTDLN